MCRILLDESSLTYLRVDLIGLSGGPPIVAALRCMNSARVRCAACSLIAGLAQNNDLVQSKLMPLALPALVHLLSYDPCTLARFNALHAISCYLLSTFLILPLFKPLYCVPKFISPVDFDTLVHTILE